MSPHNIFPRLLIFVSLAFGLAGVSAQAQSIKEKLNAVLEGLNDPDPIIRLATYEEAVASGDATVRRIALRTALQSADTDLRALALRGAFAGRNLVNFKLSKAPEVLADEAAAGTTESAVKALEKKHKNNYGLLNGYSGVLTIRLDSYEYQSGSISGYCMTNANKANESYPVMGNISGDEILLKTVCNVSYYGTCTLQAELSESAKLVGSLNCPYNSSAVVEMDLI